MASYDAVLFDAWDTIWYERNSPVDIWTTILANLGVDDIPNHDIQEAEEKTRQSMIPRWRAIETSGVATQASEIKRFWEEYDLRVLSELRVDVDVETVRSQVITQFRDRALLYPETKGVLQELHTRGYRMAIVSNGVYQNDIAERLGIATYFDTIIGSVHVGFRKPMPEIFQMALTALNIGSDQAIMVGDNWEDDVEGAKKVGIRGIHLNRTDDPSLSEESIEDLWGIVQFLQSHLAS